MKLCSVPWHLETIMHRHSLLYHLDPSYVTKMRLFVVLCVFLVYVDAFTSTLRGSTSFQTFVDQIQEGAAKTTLNQIRTAIVKVPSSVSSSGKIESTYSYFPAEAVKEGPPIVLIHGFDSSCLEFRRLAPLLAEKHDVYAIDVLGWGFNDVTSVVDFGPAAKMAHLEAFVEQVVPAETSVVAGASLGGALAITLATQRPEIVDKLVLLDAQGFIDGEGPKEIPNAIAKLGIAVLKSWPLRMFANVLAYKDKSFATWDAMLCGRLHCEIPFWMDASVNFLKSGGYY